MSYIIVDVESDGPIIGEHSMVCFGAVLLDATLQKTFYATTAPISQNYAPSALAISGYSRAQHEAFTSPFDAFTAFLQWVKTNSKGSPILLSDNNGYDASWINYYFLKYIGTNPFGWSSRRIGDLFCGFYNDPFYKWKKHRTTSPTHNPIDDAKGNAEAILYLISQGFKLKI